ncbi:MAG: 1,4-dihydroxy-2-naphthoate polyprenyltransferase [Cyclobacteriaceae bacterium]|jgi:1,4-dihydroxy-2-naphthoate octaprenyltransferase|nr:1,4-dihydroxy-2-naphthoate polyprenyltransferase [Cyclobacteriaceae bacterium]
MNIKAWITAFRLRTLPLAVSCIAMGSFLAADKGFFSWQILSLTLLTTLFLQILSNLANDYGDAVSGIDGEHRTGPKRMVQVGVISKQSMKKALYVFGFLSFVSGITLLYSTLEDFKSFITFLALGIACIFAAIAYTVGKKPYGYIGLGDLSVFIFFGLVGVGGTYYLFTQTFDWSMLLPACSSGLFAVGVLNINNVRDIESDKASGKFSLPVRMGRKKAGVYHACITGIGVLFAIVYAALYFEVLIQWLFLVTIPLFWGIAVAVIKLPSRELDPFLKRMALSTLLFVLLFGVGLLIR